jgi:hypothetical protein
MKSVYGYTVIMLPFKPPSYTLFFDILILLYMIKATALPTELHSGWTIIIRSYEGNYQYSLT